MEKPNMNSAQLNNLLNTVSKKLGVSPAQLKQDLESGKLESAMKGMKKDDAAKMQQVINNPKMMEKLINAPQAKALYEKLMGGKN
ncbi:MAG: hypothetical protein IJZ64_07350 [Ruminococcus sp.]|nr:hypothetical protein [Ruminococcus sp.]